MNDENTQTVVKIADAIENKLIAIRIEISKLANTPDFSTNALVKLTNEMNKLEKSKKDALRFEPVDETEDEDDFEQKSADAEVMKNHIRSTLLKESDYYYIHREEKFLLFHGDDCSLQSDRSLRNHHPNLVVGSDYYRAFIEVLKEDKRWFIGRTSSFADQPNMLNMLRPKILEPVEGTPHPIFDLVVRSICGDKAENIEHLEKVLIAKQQAPFQYLLPVICFSDGGGTGKSLFVSKVVSTLFGATSVNANCRMSDFAGQFNGHLAGKLAILINENCEDSYNHNAIKQIAGSPTITFTNKNQMPYEGDNSALLFVTGNSIAGAIRLSGGDVDRRFSVFEGGSNLETYVAPWLTLEHERPFTELEAKEWIVAEGQDILSNPKEVAIWLNSLIGRHGKITFIPALHGADYQKIVSIQTSLWDQVFETIFVPEFTYIRKGLLYDFYQHERQIQGNRNALGKTKFYRLASDWLAKNRPDITAITANWNLSTADVYIADSSLAGRTKPKLRSNDEFYFHAVGNQREWKVEL